MKIIVYGLNFKPEIVGIGKYSGELSDFLHDKGHSVRVITAPKYYPEWKVKNNKYHIDKNTKYKIFRCPLFVPKDPNSLKRILHLISFTLSSLPIIIKNLSWKPDCIILISPTLLCAINIFIFKFFSTKKVFTILQIQDFELEAAFNLRILQGKFLKNILLKIESYVYKSFEIVGTISQGMINKLINKKINKRKIYYFPNWVDTKTFEPKNAFEKYKNSYREELNIPPEKIIILYSGTMNRKQGFEFLVPIIEKFQNNKNLLWIFGGEGPTKKKLISDTSHISNINFLPLQDAKKMSDWLNLGDIHIIPQAEEVEDLLFPSKLLGILASGNPIISNTSSSSELGKLVAKAGIRVDPKNQIEFINALNLLIHDEEYRLDLGRKARKIAEQKFNKDLILENFNLLLKRNIENSD